jgi:metallo-beta-lactamase family protein
MSRHDRHGPPVLMFLGAAGTVTGSKFLVDVPARSGAPGRVMVDCGLYQGEKQWRQRNWDPLPVDPASVDAVALTHAHLDHCGYLPALVRGGFGGPVLATSGTTELAAVILRDSAHLQEEEAEFARRGGWSKHDPPLPLYTAADAELAIAALRTAPTATPVPLAPMGGTGRPEATVTFVPAGHILGSSSVLLESREASVLFSGDLGRPTHPVLAPRARPPAARTVVVESTYGDRNHPETDPDHTVMGDAIRRTIERGGSVVLPAFAVDRTEVVLLALAELMASGRIPDVPIWVDSPMALAALAIYRDPAHAGEVRPEALEALRGLHHLHEARTAEQSMHLNNPGTPCIIVSASGMATGGRVVHHLASLLPHARNTVMLTGYQAVGTRGRSLEEGAREVKMAGRYVRVRAEVVALEEFSVHADADEIVDWLKEMPQAPETVHLVHGEPEASRALAGRVREELDCAVSVARYGERVLLD